MAKRGTLDHPKTGRLAEALGVEPWMALGLLEAVWHWAGKYAPTGLIFEKDWPQLCRTISFSRGTSVLRDALIESGFVDLHYGKTFIHDWPDHADDATKKALARKGKGFDEYFKKSRSCRDKIPPKSRLPEPEPEPEPEPIPDVDNRARPPRPPIAPNTPPPAPTPAAEPEPEPPVGEDPAAVVQRVLADPELGSHAPPSLATCLRICQAVFAVDGAGMADWEHFVGDLLDSGRRPDPRQPPGGFFVALTREEFADWHARNAVVAVEASA